MATSNYTQNITNTRLRVTYSRADQYIYPDPPKLTFWQKLTRGIGKVFSFAAAPAAVAASVLLTPALGIPLGAGIYGLGKVTEDQLYKSSVRDQIKMAAQQPTQIYTPGLFETNQLAEGDMLTDFIAPRSMEPNISQVIINRQNTELEGIQTFQQSPEI